MKKKDNNNAIENTFNQFDDDLWVELILKSPHSVKMICMILSLDLQIEKEWEKKYEEN